MTQDDIEALNTGEVIVIQNRSLMRESSDLMLVVSTDEGAKALLFFTNSAEPSIAPMSYASTKSFIRSLGNIAGLLHDIEAQYRRGELG